MTSCCPQKKKKSIAPAHVSYHILYHSHVHSLSSRHRASCPSSKMSSIFSHSGSLHFFTLHLHLKCFHLTSSMKSYTQYIYEITFLLPSQHFLQSENILSNNLFTCLLSSFFVLNSGNILAIFSKILPFSHSIFSS